MGYSTLSETRRAALKSSLVVRELYYPAERLEMALAWFGPALASEVVSGQPHLAGPDAMRAGVGAAITTVAIGAGGAYASAGAIKLGGQALKSLGTALGGASSSGRRGGGGSSGGGKPPSAINYAGMQPKPASPPPPPTSGGGSGGKP